MSGIYRIIKEANFEYEDDEKYRRLNRMALKIFKLWTSPFAELYFIRIINNLVIEKARFLKDPPFLNPLVPPLTKRGKKYYFYYAFRQAQGVSYV